MSSIPDLQVPALHGVVIGKQPLGWFEFHATSAGQGISSSIEAELNREYFGGLLE